MLLEQVKNPVETQGMLAVATATIKATPKIFNFFADQTYSNKPLAICRELVANAIDAHTAAGCPERPVEVRLPTELDPTFRVKDFGIGMSHEFMTTSFLAYTDGSTKDDSNDQIGGFGIGSKSPFAYTDQYTLRVVHEGILSIYSMFKNEDGIPSIGMLSQSPTNERNGVEVSFPVKHEDFEVFASAAQKALMHFKPLPIVHGGTVEPPVYLSSGKNWGMRPQYGALHIIMGGVSYPVDDSNLDYEVAYDTEIKDFFRFGLDLTLPIGTCGVALSRESLSYDNRTNQAIRDALYELRDEIKDSFSTMFDQYETVYEAMEALNNEVKDSYSGRSSYLKKSALYRGQPLETFLKVHAVVGHIYPPTYRRGRHAKNEKVNWDRYDGHAAAISPGQYEVIVIDDLPRKASSMTGKRLQNLTEGLSRRVGSIVLRPADPEDDVQDVLDQLEGIPRDRYILTSELPEPARKVRAKGERPKVRMFRTNGTRKHFGMRPERFDSSVREYDPEDRPTSGVLVVMENFICPRLVDSYVKAGLLTWEELSFVNMGDAVKIKKEDWVDYHDLAQTRLKQILQDTPNLAEGLAIYNSGKLGALMPVCRQLDSCELTAAQLKRPFGKIFQIYQTYIKPLTEDHKRLASVVDAKLPARLDPNKLADSFHSKQPRAARLLELTHNYLGNEDRQFFMELI